MCSALDGVTPLPEAWTTLANAFADRVRATPSALAVYDSTDRLTYAELAARSARIAAELRGLGVRAGDHVGVALERSIEAIATMLAVFELAAVLVPIDPAWPAERRARIEADAELVCVVDGGTPQLVRREPTAVGPSLALYTSGSTGEPKAVLVGGDALLWRIHALDLALPWQAGEVACHRTPITFIDAYAEVLGPLLFGVPLFVLPRRFAVQDLVVALARERITRLLLVPSLLALLLDASPDLPPTLRLLATSGEALSEALARRFRAAAPGVRLVNIYGSTEVAGDATLVEIGDRITIGRPLAGVLVKIDAPDGELGELAVAGRVLADGYWRQPELTASRFVHDRDGTRWFRTGDLARRLPDGELVVAGRLDDQIKIGGVRIELAEIDRALESAPTVRAAATAARYDSDGRIRIVAGVVGDCDVFALREHVKARLPAAAVPAVIVCIDALPLTSHGKIDRKALAARIVEHGPAIGGDDLVARVTGWFTELTRTRVEPDDELEAVGGDSLARLGLLVRLENEGFHLEHADLPRPLTPARLAECLRAFAPVAVARCEPEGRFPLTDYQRVMVLESVANRGTAVWSDQLAFTLVGELDHAKFEAAWRDEVAAQPALRMSIDVATLHQTALPSVQVTVERIDHRDLDLERYRQRVRAEEWARLSIAFPLDAPPLFRLCLLAGPGSRHDLIFTYHHAILDGESARIVLRSVLARYAGRQVAPSTESFQAFAMRPRTVDPRWRELLAEHRVITPPEPPIATGMGDFVWRLFHRVLALRSRIAAARVRRRTRRIRALLSAAQLEPAAYAGGDLTSQPIAVAQADAIRAWARRHDTTETAVWAALFALQLAHERATNDVVFGVLVSGRDGRSADTIGMLANCLPLRVRIDRTAPFSALARQVGQGLRELEQLSSTPLLDLAKATDLPARAFLDTLFISWAFASKPPEAIEIRGGRGITMTAPHTAMIWSRGELAIGSRAFHRTDRIRRHVLALADAVSDDVSIGQLLELEAHEGGTSVAVAAL